MTIQESTICNLVQTFPILLILAQNHNRCLKTPLIYKPPSPTPSPEYYEALEALFQNILGHGHHGDDHSIHGCAYGPGSYGHGSYGHGSYGRGSDEIYKKLGIGGHATPCYTYAYPTVGHDVSHHGQGAYGPHYPYPSFHGHSYPTYVYKYPTYGFKKMNAYNLSGLGVHGYKGTYAPMQTYNLYQNHKYKVVVKKNKGRPHMLRLQNSTQYCEINGQRGDCVPLRYCEPYLEIIHNQISKSSSMITHLSKAQCGVEGKQPKVCCPPQRLRMTIVTRRIKQQGIEASHQTEKEETEGADSEESRTELGVRAVKFLDKYNSQEDEIIDDAAWSDYVDRLPQPPQCGVSNATVKNLSGGRDAKLGDYPWIALLGYKKTSLIHNTTDWGCGGSLVSNKHVLTAAHCIHGLEDSLYVVRLGEFDLSREDEATPLDVIIKKVIKHERYNSDSLENNIGVVLLEREVQLTDLIQPICLPRSRELLTNTFERYKPFVAGWGTLLFNSLVWVPAVVLQRLQVLVMSKKACADVFKSDKYKYNLSLAIDERVICTRNEREAKEKCARDSGGPLMLPVVKKTSKRVNYHLIGVLSFGANRCAETRTPAVYTRLAQFMPWIEEKILRT